MADHLAANTVSSVTTVDLPRSNMLRAGQNEGTAKGIFRPPDGNDSPCIQPYAIGYQDDDYVDCTNKPTKREDNSCSQPYAVGNHVDDDDEDDDDDYVKPTNFDAASANEQTTQPMPPVVDIQPYAVAYLYQDDYAVMTARLGEAKTDETFKKSEAAATSSNDIPTKKVTRDSSEDDTETSTSAGYDSGILEKRRPIHSNPKYEPMTPNPDPMYAPNAGTPNPIYPQNAENNSSINQQYALNTNLIFPQNSVNRNLIYPQNDVNTSPKQLQAIENSNMKDDPNASPEPTRPADRDGNPCIQPYAVGYQEEEDGDDDDTNKDPNHDANTCIQPYAVRYQEQNSDSKNKHTKHGAAALVEQAIQPSPTDVDIQPYAVAYKSEGEETQTKEPLQKIETVSNHSNDIPNNTSECGPSRRDTDTSDNTDDTSNLRGIRRPLNTPNLMNEQNALQPDPMYAANVRPQTSCGKSVTSYLIF
ncbi:Hypp8878 [Branchiostoma lanceolatum]|uniref:Hypp8878 protein n=1 Tax=Branchiostoma lanceolatum TaxID=7740 RepID=A0A8J9ZAY5_BRALA|nr:Hypp8878 [Branchiostoma lanceolatum]